MIYTHDETGLCAEISATGAVTLRPAIEPKQGRVPILENRHLDAMRSGQELDGWTSNRPKRGAPCK